MLREVTLKTLVAVLVLAVVRGGYGQEPVEGDWRTATENRIAIRLNALPVRDLSCDFLLNSSNDPASFPAAVSGKTTVLNFWRPSCEYCKPLLKDLAEFAMSGIKDVAVASAAEESSRKDRPNPKVRGTGQTDGDETIAGVLRSLGGLPFPVCGYRDHGQTKRWQAEGVPVTVVFDTRGRVTRVVFGGPEGSDLLRQLRGGWRP